MKYPVGTGEDYEARHSEVMHCLDRCLRSHFSQVQQHLLQSEDREGPRIPVPTRPFLIQPFLYTHPLTLLLGLVPKMGDHELGR